MKPLLISALLLVSSSLHARPGVEAKLSYFNYHETSDSGDLLNREQGWLPELRLSWGFNSDKHSAELSTAYLGGAVDYRGQTQGGLAHQTSTDQEIFSIAGQWRWSYNTSVAVVTAWHHYWWRRDIQPSRAVRGLTEDYAWHLFQLGVEGQYYGWKGLVSWNRTLFASMVIQPTGCTARAELAPKPDNGASINVSRNLDNGWRLSFGHRLMRMAASDSVAADSCSGTIFWREPDNQMQLSHMGISKSF